MFRDWYCVQWTASGPRKWRGDVKMKWARRPGELLGSPSVHCLWVEQANDDEHWNCRMLRGPKIIFEGRAKSRDAAMRLVQDRFERTVHKAAR